MPPLPEASRTGRYRRLFSLEGEEVKHEFDKLAERMAEALEALRGGCPTDALRTLEKANRETNAAREFHKQQLHLEFWK